MGLVDPVELVDPSELGDVHFIAIGGAGMSGIAALYLERGIRVSGSDRADSPALDELRRAGAEVFVGHDAAQLGSARTVVVSSAIPASNPEWAAARERGLRVWHRSAALAALMLGQTGVAVGGTHGKTTTSAMVVAAAEQTRPGYVVGAPLGATGRSAALGAGEVFVVEADESDGSFLQYPAEIAVVTNVEADHLDNWGDPADYAAGFEAFLAHVRFAVINLDDPGARRLGDRVRALAPDVAPGLVTYGTDARADVRLVDATTDASGGHARLVVSEALVPGGAEVELRLPVPGAHNLSNAAGAAAAAMLVGVPPAAAVAGLAGFAGTARRFQLVGVVGDGASAIRVVDDYAHHPTEVEAALRAARESAGAGRVVVCFQPHLFSRTRDFADEFAAALALADEVVLCDVYPAREEPIAGVSSELIARPLVEAVGEQRVALVERAAAVTAVVERARPGDLVLTMGAGDVTELGPRIVAALGEGAR